MYENTEFLIIGQGLAGSFLAMEMVKNKIDFRILSSPEITPASGVAAGLFNPFVFRRFTKCWLLDEMYPVMGNSWKEQEKLFGKQFIFEKKILKPLSTQEKELWVQRINDTGFSSFIEKITETKPVDSITDSFAYGIVKGSGYADLPSFLKKVKEYLTSYGFYKTIKFKYDELKFEQNYVEYGSVRAKRIIFCEGYKLIENPYFYSVRLAPAKGEIIIFSSEGLTQEYILNKRVFVVPVGGNLFKAGSTYIWNDLTESPTPEGLNSIKERLDKLISVDYQVQDYIAGVRPTVADRRPVLGFHPAYKNFAVFNGLGTKGVMLAPYFAQEMLKLLTVQNYEVHTEARIERFLK